MQISQEAAREVTEAVARGLSGVGYWIPWVERAVRVVVLLAGAWAVTRVSRRLLRRLRAYTVRSMDRRGNVTDLELEKRSATIITVVSKLVSTLVWMVTIVMALNELTFNIQPLIAGLGVAGIALGLGAQTLIKDWLGGVFLLLEDQIRIGDSVSVNGISGSVEEINLRTTVLRSENGGVHILANGNINQLSNFTREYSYYVFETTIAHRADADQALRIIQEAGVAIAAEPQFEALILAPLELMGVDKLTERGALLRARIKTLPSKQAAVGRELNRTVKERFDRAGIAFPPVA